jgi:flagellar hook protein FlgE
MNISAASSILATALEGMSRAEARLDGAAAQIATWEGGDTVDLSAEAVNLMQARVEFQANANVIRVAREIG